MLHALKLQSNFSLTHQTQNSENSTTNTRTCTAPQHCTVHALRYAWHTHDVHTPWYGVWFPQGGGICHYQYVYPRLQAKLGGVVVARIVCCRYLLKWFCYWIHAWHTGVSVVVALASALQIMRVYMHIISLSNMTWCVSLYGSYIMQHDMQWCNLFNAKKHVMTTWMWTVPGKAGSRSMFAHVGARSALAAFLACHEGPRHTLFPSTTKQSPEVIYPYRIQKETLASANWKAIEVTQNPGQILE